MKAAGFSLVEVLVATAVVTVGVASVAQLFTVSARANRIANATTMTLLLAQQKMEELRADAADAERFAAFSARREHAGLFRPHRLERHLAWRRLHRATRRICLRSSLGDRAPGGLEGASGGAGYAIVMKVLVIELTSGHADEGSGVARTPGEARLVGVKTRKAG